MCCQIMINKNEWLAFAKLRGMFKELDYAECGMGFYLEEDTDIKIDLKDQKYIAISSPANWLNFGLENNFINEIGCPEHELKDSNKLFTFSSLKIIYPDIYKLRLGINESLTFNSMPINKNYFGYMSTDPELLKYLINILKDLDECDSFIDIGCGPGSVLKLVNNLYDNVYGIDIEPEFIKVAKTELPLANILLDNAESYIIPNKKMHIFIFNPFNNKVLKKFLDNNIENIKKNKSIIIYNNTFTADHLLKIYGLKYLYKENYFAIYNWIISLSIKLGSNNPMPIEYLGLPDISKTPWLKLPQYINRSPEFGLYLRLISLKEISPPE